MSGNRPREVNQLRQPSWLLVGGLAGRRVPDRQKLKPAAVNADGQ
jgi:hypothetical protein